MVTVIQSLRRSMKLLDVMSRGGKREYSITELAAAVELPPSTVYRMLQTFALDRYVTGDKATHLYRLGPALAALSSAAQAENDLKSLALPFLKEIAEKTGDDAFLMELDGFQSRVIAKAEGPGRIKIVNSFEANSDLHCGANRKMLLAFQSDDYIDEYIARGLKAYTPSTITAPEALWKEIRAIRAEKISFSSSEFIEGAIGISAPVFDSANRMIASMGTSAPAFQISEARIDADKRIISDCAEGLSRALGADTGAI